MSVSTEKILQFIALRGSEDDVMQPVTTTSVAEFQAHECSRRGLDRSQVPRQHVVALYHLILVCYFGTQTFSATQHLRTLPLNLRLFAGEVEQGQEPPKIHSAGNQNAQAVNSM